MACPSIYSFLVPEHVLELKFSSFKSLFWFSFQQIFIEHMSDARHCAGHVGEKGKTPVLKGFSPVWWRRESITK